MKSYKDLDKDIILNAPEGAMWWCHLNGYYKYQGSDVYVYYPEECDWFYSANFRKLLSIQEGVDFSSGFLKPIPLPNTEIPWEATEDSMGGGKCPVPDRIVVRVNGRYSGFGKDFWWGVDKEDIQITSYKIIDEDYLPTEQEEDIVSYKLPLYTSAHKIEEKSMEQYSLPLPKTKEQLISNLEFLQILHDKFPSIRESVEQYMNSQLDIFICEDWENEG